MSAPILILAAPFLIAAAVLVVTVSFYARVRRRRREAFATLALQLGLTYSAEDPFGIASSPFPLMEFGPERHVENVMWGIWQGIDIRAFDYWLGQPAGEDERHEVFECAIVPLELTADGLTVYHGSTIVDKMGMTHIQFESEEFNRVYQVRSMDKKFANDLIDERMMAWLLDAGSGYAFEVVGSQMLCYSVKKAPTDFVPLLGTAKGFVDHIPSVVYSLYPATKQESSSPGA
jgi:hypothetical protein